MLIAIGVVVVFLMLAAIGSGSDTGQVYGCIGCKKEFPSRSMASIDSYDYEGTPVRRDACPTCKSDMIYKKG